MFNIAREFAYQILTKEANDPTYKAIEDLDFYRQGVEMEYLRIKQQLEKNRKPFER